VQLDILNILKKLLPYHYYNTYLSYYGNAPTNLGKLLIMLHREIFTSKLTSCPTYYIEDHKIPDQYLLYTYSPDFVFPPQTVKCFKYTQEWLEQEIRRLTPDEWGLKNPKSILPEPPTSKQETKPNLMIITNPEEPDSISYINSKQSLYLDVETYLFENKNTLTNLGLRTIRLDHHYIIWEELFPEAKQLLINTLIRKDIYVFNLNMEASQLKHAGSKLTIIPDMIFPC